MVYATGTDTYFGKTAQMVQGPESASHFQKAVLKIGDYLIILAVALVALISHRRAIPSRSGDGHACSSRSCFWWRRFPWRCPPSCR